MVEPNERRFARLALLDDPGFTAAQSSSGSRSMTPSWPTGQPAGGTPSFGMRFRRARSSSDSSWLLRSHD